MTKHKLHVWLLAGTLALAGLSGCTKSSNRTDADVTKDVQGKINADNNVPTKQISVDARDGVVTLSGTVGSDTERLAASNDASTVDGVKTVMNNLQVNNPAAMNMPADQNMNNMPSSPSATAPRNNGSRASSTRGHGPKPASAASSTTMPSNVNTASADTPPPAAPAKATVVIPQVTIPAGTNLSVFINDGLSSETAQPGDRFAGTLGEPVYVDNQVVIPRNANVDGRVVDAKNAAKFSGSSALELQLTDISYNGKTYHVTTDHWSKQGSGRGKNTAAKVGGGAALGAIIGGLAGGGKGAAIGATVGAGAGTTAQAVTRGQQVILKPESMLSFNLQAPITVVPAANADQNRRPMNPPDSGSDR